jgi:CubicO group peptidase (beta-lactamase class C family)
VARAAGARRGDAVVRERLLAPLGMAETRMRGAELASGAAAANLARPHDLVADTLRPLPDWTRRLVDGVAPAGAMYSTAADMTRWLRFLLAGGRLPDGRRLISEGAFAELFAPQALVPADEFYPSARLTRPAFTAYGLGWFLQDYRGEKVAYHTGSIDGTVALVGLLPARHVGMVVFANRDHAELRHALMLRLFDAHLPSPATPAGPRARWRRARWRPRRATGAPSCARSTTAPRAPAASPAPPTVHGRPTRVRRAPRPTTPALYARLAPRRCAIVRDEARRAGAPALAPSRGRPRAARRRRTSPPARARRSDGAHPGPPSRRAARRPPAHPHGGRPRVSTHGLTSPSRPAPHGRRN